MNTTADPFRELADSLRLRIEVIQDRAARERDPEAHLQRLKEASEEIVVRQRRLPTPVDPQLAHFLERCSYDKALAWLEAEGTATQ